MVLALGLIASAGYFGTSFVLAGDNTSAHQTLVYRIAQKFNLNESDVEAVFDAVRDEKQAEMKAKREERLSQAVKDGVLTEDQKTALLSKMEEHLSEKKENREEMQSWFKSQGIDETKLREYLMPFGKSRGMRMHR